MTENERLNALGSLALSLDLANDTIRIALRIAGQNPDSMNQFERASALLDIVQEFAALQSARDAQRIERMWGNIVSQATERNTRKAFVGKRFQYFYGKGGSA